MKCKYLKCVGRRQDQAECDSEEGSDWGREEFGSVDEGSGRAGVTLSFV